MKHYTICEECQKTEPGKLVWAQGELDSDLVVLCICPKGHKIVSGLYNELWDILYFSAMDSFTKGFYSESVMTFTSSLERVYEVFVKATLLKEGVEISTILNFWKEIKNQSERQYGAFCLQYVKVTGNAWRIDNKYINFRNKVIHQGHIATYTEVFEYAEYLTLCQTKILYLLHQNYRNECRKISNHKKVLLKEKILRLIAEHKTFFAQTTRTSLLDWHNMDMKIVTFTDALESMLETQKRLGF